MSRRVDDHFVLKMKLQRNRPPDKIADDRHRLSALIEHAVRPLVNRRAQGRHGLSAQRLAHDIAALECDRVLHCSLRGLGSTQDEVALDQVLRRRRAVPPDATGDRLTLLTPRLLVVHWPEWLVSLFDLLCLTRRSWTYLRLFTTRAAGAGWPRRLAQLIWGSTERHEWLRAEMAGLEAVGWELQDAYDAISRSSTKDPVEQFLHAAGTDLAQALPGGVAAAARAGALAVLWGHWPQKLPRNSKHPHLLAALAELEDLVGKAGRNAVSAAWTELCVEQRSPAATAPAWDAIAIVVGDAPAMFRKEPGPSDVLAAIGSTAPETPPSPGVVLSEGVLAAEGLRQGILKRIFEYPPPWYALLQYIFDLLLRGNDFDEIRLALAAFGPRPADLDRRLLVLAAQRLRDWLLVVQRSAEGARSSQSWDLPQALETDPKALEEAAGAVKGWLESPEGRPGQWGELADLAAEAIIAAVLSVCLDILSEAMEETYSEHYAAQPRVS